MRIGAVLLLLIGLLSTAVAAYAQDGAAGPATGASLPPAIAPEMFERGRQAFQQQDFEQAVLDFSLFIYLNPTDGQAYYARAVSYQQIGNVEHALGDLSQAIRFTDSAPDLQAVIYARRGDIHASEGNTDEALSDYGDSVQLAPSPDVYAGRGLLYLSESEFEAAISDFDEAINLSADSPILYLYRATAKTELDDQADAASDYFEWVNRIQQRTSQEDLLEAGQSLTVVLEPSLVYAIPFKAEIGQTLNIVAANLSGDVDPLVVVVDEQGNPLVANDDSRGGDTSAVISGYHVPSEGFYTLYLTHSASGYNGRVIVRLEARSE